MSVEGHHLIVRRASGQLYSKQRSRKFQMAHLLLLSELAGLRQHSQQQYHYQYHCHHNTSTTVASMYTTPTKLNHG